MDDRFKHIAGDLHFKPLKSRRTVIPEDDERLAPLRRVGLINIKYSYHVRLIISALHFSFVSIVNLTDYFS